MVTVLVLAAPAHAQSDARPPSLQWRLQEFAGEWWVKIHLSERAMVTVRLASAGALERRVRARSVPAGTARLALGRLRGGRYQVQIVARHPSGRRATVAHAIRLPRLVTIAVSGDLLIHTPVAARALVNGGGRRYRFGPMLARISPLIRQADLALCHLEHPIGRGPPTGYPRFRAPAALAGAIRAAGYDVCSTASNHTLARSSRPHGAPVAPAHRRSL